ncbi:glycoside hydrolase family 2 TIM barrel-domain containing protein [Dactylosporangium sp. NPDC049525]|uniref:glycoside hydrolase family 2 TIM barrel-domain containing protein n=1 Tax=Dactylosporangium sp. NPDC049525 TaxID=3154730 RepID=UPI00344AC599
MTPHRRDVLKLLGAGTAGALLPISVLAGSAQAAGSVTVSLDGGWRFATDPGGTGEAAGWAQPGFDDSGWATLQVPGNWDVHDAWAGYRGWGWHRRTVASPAVVAGQVVRLRFEAVYYRARVWFNGAYLGEHQGGYTPFEFDVTSRLTSTNTVVVAASNSYSIGAWWPWGGISRSVSLTVDAAVRIERQHVIATPDLGSGAGSVVNWVTLSNAGASARTVTVRSTYPWGAPATTVTVPAKGTAEARLDSGVAAGQFELWGLDRPVLYTCDTTVSEGSTVLHGKADRFGFRKVEVRGTAIHLNGEPVRLNGYNRVGDDRVVGATEPTYLVRRDLDRMKAAGAGLMRIHHVPQTPELLDYADEIGMLLIEEIPVWGSGANLDPANETTRAELRDMIRRDYNHPSIVAWSVANEIRGASEEGRVFVREMIAYIKSTLDSTRLCTYVSNTSGSAATPGAEALQYTDFACINMYGGFAGGADHVHGLYPDKPVFVSEYSSDSFTFPTTREDVDFRTTSDAAATVFPGRPWIVGSAHWTFNDYRSSFGGTSPNQVRGWGIQNVWGQRKRAYAQLQATNALVAGLGITAATGLSLLTVNPRADAPARVLRGHRLAWQVTDAQGTVIDGRIVPLPDIAPGAATLQRAVRWTDPGTAVRQWLTLLAPSGHEIAVSTLDIRVPAAPVIRATVAANGAVRVVFDRVANADNYRVLTSTGVTGADTVNGFADLTGLTNGSAIQVRVVAVNGAGVSPASAPVTVTPTGTLALPPKIQDVVPVAGGFVLGFIVAPNATDHQVQAYSGTTVVSDVTTALKGSVRGTVAASSVRIKGSNTVWSEQAPVTAATFTVHGALAADDRVAVRITPHPEAERYEVTATGGGRTVVRVVESSAVELLTVTGLVADAAQQVSVRCGTAAGWSAPQTLPARTTPPLPTGTPAAPTGLGSSTSGGVTTLVWSAVSGAAGYLVAAADCGPERTVAVVAGGTTLVLGPQGTVAGIAYRVTAVGESGTSAPSAGYVVPGTPGARQVTVTPLDTTADCAGSIRYRETGTWLASSLAGVDGTPSRYSNTGGSTATWAPTLRAAGTYLVEVWVPASTSSTTAAAYQITHAGGTAQVTVDQVAAGGTWRILGTWAFAQGTAGKVVLTAGTTFARANAVRFTPA